MTLNNTFSQQDLEQICKVIDKIDEFHHIEILKIIVRNSSVVINDNIYGICINLTLLHDDVIHKIKDYLKYVDIQESEIKNLENKKNEYLTNFFPNKQHNDP
jgi:hypothetical protein